MRELKFRVYMMCKLVNECKECGTHKDHYTKGFKNIPEDLTLSKLLIEDYPDEIQQFTGLKDKNGKEIYEGDIISFGPERSEIYWCQTGFYCNTFRFDRTELMDAFERYGSDFLIIGNIFENPELIGG